LCIFAREKSGGTFGSHSPVKLFFSSSGQNSGISCFFRLFRCFSVCLPKRGAKKRHFSEMSGNRKKWSKNGFPECTFLAPENPRFRALRAFLRTSAHFCAHFCARAHFCAHFCARRDFLRTSAHSGADGFPGFRSGAAESGRFSTFLRRTRLLACLDTISRFLVDFSIF